MSTVAVFAHFDPGGAVAPHVDRYLAHLSAAVDRVVVVSTADLTVNARRRLGTHGDLVMRENVGYDFYSWKTGLDHVSDWDRHDRVVICNDSVIGPFRPLTELFYAMRQRRADFWGITQSRELEPHIQSWFVVFERPVVQSGLLHAFWRAMTPVSDRFWVIRRYEIGMSRLLRIAGFRMDAYFHPRVQDRIRSAIRHQRYLRRRGSASLESVLNGWNPTIACWDAALHGRLPFVKVDVLRDDPYMIGAERMVHQLEQAHPEAFVGVREYLDRTREDYARLRAWTAASHRRRHPGDRHGSGDKGTVVPEWETSRGRRALDAPPGIAVSGPGCETIPSGAACRGQRARSSGTSRHRPVGPLRRRLVCRAGWPAILHTRPSA